MRSEVDGCQAVQGLDAIEAFGFRAEREVKAVRSFEQKGDMSSFPLKITWVCVREQARQASKESVAKRGLLGEARDGDGRGHVRTRVLPPFWKQIRFTF